MTIRALDAAGDWTFGMGKQNYLTGSEAIAQDVQTKIQSWLNDLFFAMNFGVDWRNLLGGTNLATTQAAILMQVRTMILKSVGIVKINSVQANLDSNRRLFISWSVNTIYSSTETGTATT
jgi:hypothetical protein